MGYNISFLAIFPGFLIYNFLIFKYGFYPYLGGYFTLVTAALSPLLVLGFKLNRFDCLFVFTMLFFLSVSVIHYMLSESGVAQVELLVWTVVYLFNVLYLFFLFKKAYVFYVHIWPVLLYLVFYSLMIFFNLEGTYHFNPRSMSKDVSTYLIFAFLYIVPVFIVFSYLLSKNKMLLLCLFFFVSMSSIFLIGSRSVLIFYVVSSLITYIYFKGAFTKEFVFVCVVALLLSMLYLMFDIELNNRIMRISASDESVSNRYEYIVFALNEIIESPIWGNYGAYLSEFGSVSAYPHNFILVWLNNGLIGLVLYLWLLLLPALAFLGKRKRFLRIAECSPYFYFIYVLSFLLYIFLLMKVLVSDQYLTLYLGVSSGVFSLFYSVYKSERVSV
ncbi:O-antigen ligase family protein [Thalassolituus hydrocarboniclasticus]|uniref:O-antigen ligase-related domain-containing protein n=1 Tax=Thalassolituus hydrocarboniclasticus TaxID=2742796 RepID=A0ABY6ABJ0_9GAMM|nr:O-antigen ligase family protein [Thalassolituus hydrocarboniclasticus]UXD87948.1 hypothetical protein HUF19_11130 [Thalassolituus hydrocarboniclasticus]